MFIVDNSTGSNYEGAVLSTYRKISQWAKTKPESDAARNWIAAQMKRNEEFFLESDQCPILTVAHMKAFEQFVDRIFKKFGIDFEFTKHFRERMSHERNDPCIDMKELASMIQKIYKKYQNGEKSLNKFVDAEVVIKDLQSDLNMPIAIEYDRKNDQIDVIAKTIMRKKNFRSSSPEIKI
jgi:hypothetical protein